MTLDPLLAAPPLVQLHALSALAAIPLGAVVLWRPKGTALHRALGRLWVGLMAVAAVSSAFVHEMRMLGPFGPIHLLTVLVLWTLARGLWAILVRRDVAAHRKAMADLYVWSLLVAGAFTLWPGRRMNLVLFGPEGSGPAVVGALALIVGGVLASYYRDRLARLAGPAKQGLPRPR